MYYSLVSTILSCSAPGLEGQPDAWLVVLLPPSIWTQLQHLVLTGTRFHQKLHGAFLPTIPLVSIKLVFRQTAPDQASLPPDSFVAGAGSLGRSAALIHVYEENEADAAGVAVKCLDKIAMHPCPNPRKATQLPRSSAFWSEWTNGPQVRNFCLMPAFGAEPY